MKPFAQIVCRGAMILAFVAVLASGCGKKTAPDVLARVGGQVITVDDFKAELQYRISNRQPVPDRRALLEDMIARLTLVERAKAAGLENATDVRRTVEDVLIAKLRETELESQLNAAKVAPAEIHAAYEQHAAHFTQPPKAHLAFIYLAADPRQATNRLVEIAARVSEAHRLALALPVVEKGFGQVAADYSEDQVTRYRGGDGGWFTPDLLAGRWPKELITAGLALKNIGDTSEVIRAADGFYFAKKMDCRPSVVTPLAQAQAGLERQLLAEKRARMEEQFRQPLRVGQVQTDLQLLSQVAYPTQSTVNVAARPPSSPGSP